MKYFTKDLIEFALFVFVATVMGVTGIILTAFCLKQLGL